LAVGAAGCIFVARSRGRCGLIRPSVETIHALDWLSGKREGDRLAFLQSSVVHHVHIEIAHIAHQSRMPTLPSRKRF
ncbi:hypothetical protein KCU87_g227, partial [Aureobasidium melanogenum]